MEKSAAEIGNKMAPLKTMFFGIKEKLGGIKEKLGESPKILSDKLVRDFNRNFSAHHDTFSLDDALFLSTRSFLEQTIILQEYRVLTKKKKRKV